MPDFPAIPCDPAVREFKQIGTGSDRVGRIEITDWRPTISDVEEASKWARRRHWHRRRRAHTSSKFSSKN